MADLHVQIIKNKGRKEYAVLPYEEFLRIQEDLQDYEDLRCLKEAKEAEKDAVAVTMDQLKKRIARKKTSAKK